MAAPTLLMRRCLLATALVGFVSLIAVPTSVHQASAEAAPWRWHSVFREGFSARSLDGGRWQTCYWWSSTTCSITVNGELELYDHDDVAVRGGSLRLRAQRRDMVGWNGLVYHYTSGMVMSGGLKGSTRPGFTFTYGYVEARVRVPKGTGLWPAFWLLPASYNSRPEIDVMEILGGSTHIQHMNFHYVRADGTRGDAGATWKGPDFAAGWHRFGLEWTPDALVWYVDRVPRWRFTARSLIPHEPMYVLANLAVGGDWPGAPAAATRFPTTYLIDYIRVWQSRAMKKRGSLRFLAGGPRTGSARIRSRPVPKPNASRGA